jgi:ribosomal subunit interface protein
MQMIITGRHVDISEVFRSTVEEGLQELVTKYHINPIEAHVTLSKQRHLFLSDIDLHVARGINIRSRGEGADGYACFHNALETLTLRLRKYKKRLSDMHKHHTVHYEEARQYILESEEEENAKDLAPPVIAELQMEIPTLSVGDALMRMDLSQEAAFVFRNTNHGQINVLYRRSDGNIGWVDPKTANYSNS